ncbi:DUF4113 domain-containing protein [Halopseudomonas yangmingensis]|uniref:DUF4113 domain-containing protein n=1 Tax=Halopseudomonas yangmingensis TaxID=1720063 RepID=UPI000B8530E7
MRSPEYTHLPLDETNSRWGRGTLRWVRMPLELGWEMRLECLSPLCTTYWQGT